MVDSNTVLEVVDVTKSFGAMKAVRGISLEAQRGETLAIIGPNGAGKSTLFGVIASEHKPTSGRVEFRGTDVSAWPASRRCRAGMSRTFQVASFFGSHTVRSNLTLARQAAKGHPLRPWNLFGGSGPDVRIVDEYLDSLSLLPLADRRADTLAQGDRKRLELAMALVQEPDLLLLDEPTAGMSLQDARRTTQLLLDIRKSQPDLTIVLTAHDMEVVFSVSDRVILMSQGRIVLSGTPAEVEAAPETGSVYLGTTEGASNG